jgi:hypothetical protein
MELLLSSLSLIVGVWGLYLNYKTQKKKEN